MDELLARLEKEFQDELKKLETARRSEVVQLNETVAKLHVKHSAARSDLTSRKNAEMKSIDSIETAKIKQAQKEAKQKRTQATEKYKAETEALNESISKEMEPCNESALSSEAKFRDAVAELSRNHNRKIDEARSASGPLGSDS